MPQLETGKINCVRLPYCGRLPPGALPLPPSTEHRNRSIELAGTKRASRRLPMNPPFVIAGLDPAIHDAASHRSYGDGQ
jgi:hypothetical protein